MRLIFIEDISLCLKELQDKLFIFSDNRHMKVVGLSALRTGRLYPPGNIPGAHFC